MIREPLEVFFSSSLAGTRGHRPFAFPRAEARAKGPADEST